MDLHELQKELIRLREVERVLSRKWCDESKRVRELESELEIRTRQRDYWQAERDKLKFGSA